MPCPRQVRKILHRRSGDAKRTLAVDCRLLAGDDAPGLVAYLWIARTFEQGYTHELRLEDQARCFVAYEYFDYRLWGESPVRVHTKMTKRLLQIHPDGAHEFTVKFFPRADAASAEDDSLDCGYDCADIVALQSGRENTISEWYGVQAGAGPVLRIGLEVNGSI